MEMQQESLESKRNKSMKEEMKALALKYKDSGAIPIEEYLKMLEFQSDSIENETEGLLSRADNALEESYGAIDEANEALYGEPSEFALNRREARGVQAQHEEVADARAEERNKRLKARQFLQYKNARTKR